MADMWWPIVSVSIVAIIVLVGVLLLWKVIKEKRSGFVAADERTQKINGKAAFYTLFIGQYFILALLAAIIIQREFFGLPEPEAGYPLIASLLVYSLSFLALRWYLGRRGENP